MTGRAWLAIIASIAAIGGPAAAADRPLRILTLDQCADQYVLALAPDADLTLSPRADDPDAWMRREARGRRMARPGLEAAVAARPQVVVRYWGGDPRLLSALTRRGVRVVEIADATDFEGVRANIRAVAAGVGESERGETLIRRMDARLTPPPATTSQAPALYLTAGGFTSGPGSMVDAMLRAAGFANAERRPGYQAVSVERIALHPPVRFVLGFFEQLRADWRGPGRHPVVRRVASGRTAARLPAAVLTCPAWFAADGVEMIRGGGA